MGQLAEARLEGEEELKRFLGEVAKEYPMKVVAAGARAAMKPFITKAKSMNPRFAKLYKVRVKNYKKRTPTIIAGSFATKKKK